MLWNLRKVLDWVREDHCASALENSHPDAFVKLLWAVARGKAARP
jgi:hypothetical protein